MSFQASHLNFAQKVIAIIKPQDLTRYFSGTLYPDSRYITKVDRAKTHTNVRIEPKKILNLTDDFDKGWQVHLWYDKLALHHLDQIALGRPYQPEDMYNPEIWIQVTGAKLVEDLFWWQNIDWPQIIPYLKFTKNPYNEDKQILNDWYQHFIDFYPRKPDLEAYREQAAFMGIAPEKIERIQRFAHTLHNDQDKNLRIQKVMAQVIKEFKNLIGK
ncbi:MAG: hypothetical protein NTX82_01990 [Candidatus Parcubacteria bacterium]|nr:hypothetical protein [Candidatus Parcubacteria bacterium]